MEYLQYLDSEDRVFPEQLREHSYAHPFIYEDGDILTLMFQSSDIQSEMSASDPNALMLSYTRTVTGFLLFNASPKRIAMIGLGGGSIAKWCYHRLSEADITVIEINPKVIALRNVFHIPSDNHRFHILQGDGSDYVAETSDAPEVLIVDGFDNSGQPPQLCSQEFYDDCYRALDANGVLVVNVCGRDHGLSIERIRRSFQQKVLVVLPEDGTNKIVFAVKRDRLWTKDESIRELLGRMSLGLQLPPTYCNS